MNYRLESNIPFLMRRGNFLFVISLSTGLMICALAASSFGSIRGLWHTIISIGSCSETFVMREERAGGAENDDGNNEWEDQHFFQAQNIWTQSRGEKKKMYPSTSYFQWYKSSVWKTGSHSLTKSQEVAVLAPVFAGSYDTGQVILLHLPSESNSSLMGLPRGSNEKSVCKFLVDLKAVYKVSY